MTEKVTVELNSENGENEELVEELGEVIEEISSDAVRLAEIEAEKEITIAAIQEEGMTTRTEALEETRQAEIEVEKERVTWQEERILKLEAELEEVKNLLNTSIQQPLEEVAEEVAEVMTEQLSETVPEQSSILANTPDPISEIETEVSVQSGDEEVEVVANARRKFRRI